jgi:hypothetical protein
MGIITFRRATGRSSILLERCNRVDTQQVEEGPRYTLIAEGILLLSLREYRAVRPKVIDENRVQGGRGGRGKTHEAKQIYAGFDAKSIER